MKRTNLLLPALIYSLMPISVQGAQLALSQTPLFLGGSVPPNVFFSLDDSGSMDWEVSLDSYWEACAYDPNITGVYSNNATCGSKWSGDDGLRSYGNAAFRNFNYIYNNSDNIYNYLNPGGCSSTWIVNAIEACPISGVNDWRAFSSSLNQIYYSPDLRYIPWNYNCTSGTPCADASFSAARSYPVQGTSNYDLVRNLAGMEYHVWVDDKGYSGTRPLRAGSINVNSTPNNQVDLWDSHIRIVFNAANVQVYSIRYAPTNAGLNPTTQLQATLTDTSACYNILGSNDVVRQIYNGTLSYTSTDDDSCLSITEAKTNVANWYQYNRRRSMAARGAVAYVINQYPYFKYGFNTINDAFFKEVPPSTVSDFTLYNNAILDSLMTMDWKPVGTPLRSGLDRAGKYYSNLLSGKVNPISRSCQQNYSILMTDGYWNESDSISSTIGDVDKDGYSKTLADVAYYYYKTDLSTLPNIVSTSTWDPANWQHMVTYTMGLGLNGNLVAGSDGWPIPVLKINSNWGNPFASDAAKVDDLWHAAFNSKGSYFDLKNPVKAGEALDSTLSNIALRNSSNTTVAQNSSSLNMSSTIYQATLNTSSWQGDLVAYPVSLNGVISDTASWSAQCMLTGGKCLNPAGTFTGLGYNERVIVTRNWNGTNNGVPFRWPSNYTSFKSGSTYPRNLTNFMANAPFTITTTTGSQITANQKYGAALVEYLRGRRSNENQFGGSYKFRDRSTILGDIVSSNPIYVPPPYRYYTDTFEAGTYSGFKSTYKNRKPIVYVGANDGMLHGFDAATGKELLAYIPGIRDIYSNLPQLSLKTYAHRFFVDGSPVEADVYTSGAWRTIVAGNLRNGGQGVYALDVTNPAQFTEANANKIYLWEFTDENDADVGYVQGNVTIAKVRTGLNQSKWAVIFGNGYNNSQADGFASTTGRAALFVLFIEQGAGGNWIADTSYIKIPVGTSDVGSPNGLAQPYAVDINDDYIVDYVYAGDLKGNLWKFDLRNTSPVNWKTSASALFTASQTAAGDQPITAPLVVSAHPTGIQNGVMVYFGTGKYLELTDHSTTGQTTQAFYGIWDKLDSSTVTKSTLVQQEIVAEVTPSGSTDSYRVVTSNPINWKTPNQNRGWYINLMLKGASSNYGERQITQPILRNGNAIFTTLIPNADPCGFGGNSWLMEVNAASGGAPNATPFDVNNDGVFSADDYLEVLINGNKKKLPVAGIKSSVGMTTTPAIMMSEDKSKETKILSGSQGLNSLQENPSMGPVGRQNWRQLY